MNHQWTNNRCSKCGVTRKKKKAKVVQCRLLINSAGLLAEKPAVKVVQLWAYSQGGFNRPDCPDVLKVA